ncbi:MAG TPA: GTP-binding protein [Thermoleophilaceae bacterium]|nr:GTP-binding protein [Thermoleophilaceae bacterium]
MAPLEAPQRTSELMRVATAGSVDDGKSTLIGRLLLETEQILEDQYEAVERASKERGDGYVNLALLTDGLRAEREQGITIDVAYRYFQTDRRKFVLADTPGHEQYTRNMVTGASTADVALVLVDARKGVVEQSRRHAHIAALLRTPHVVVCVNKMDLVDFDEGVFDSVAAEFPEAHAIPLSALNGDNVTERSANTPYYSGPPLLELLEELEPAPDRDDGPLRFPVQWVVRPMTDEHHDYRGYAGQVAGGTVSPGDEVTVLPSGARTRVQSIDTIDGELDEAFYPLSVTLRLEGEHDVSRGSLIAAGDSPPEPVRELEAEVCWMAQAPLKPGARLRVKHLSQTVAAKVESIDGRLDVNSGEHGPADELELNDIGLARLRLASAIAADPYAENRTTGSFILVDDSSNDTVGAGMVVA